MSRITITKDGNLLAGTSHKSYLTHIVNCSMQPITLLILTFTSISRHTASPRLCRKRPPIIGGKSVFVKPLDFVVDGFKKTIEYNNGALDSKFLPIVSDFIIHSEVLLASIKFLLPAYDLSTPNGRSDFLPAESMRRMQECYDFMIGEFPEIMKSTGSGPLTILNATELEAVYREASKKNPKIEFLEKLANQ
ncbi:hypothetical protein [Burkholderia gladioli]|uniref:hypothetical protein n=1 Tax=Burkholderia gladioli TaxID=28095 RepID=UPI00163E4E6C|nr:hypothetical protein [Burkholderia gladioli]